MGSKKKDTKTNKLKISDIQCPSCKSKFEESSEWSYNLDYMCTICSKIFFIVKTPKNFYNV